MQARSSWLVVAGLMLTGCGLDPAEVCGPAMRYDDARFVCVCDDDAIEVEGGCQRCAPDEVPVAGVCACPAGEAEDASGACAAVPGVGGCDAARPCAPPGARR